MRGDPLSYECQCLGILGLPSPSSQRRMDGRGSAFNRKGKILLSLEMQGGRGQYFLISMAPLIAGRGMAGDILSSIAQ